MQTNDRVLYSIVSREFYEPLSRYVALDKDFHAYVTELLPSGWSLTRHSLWYSCARQGIDLPAHGWKIHVSTDLKTSRTLLLKVAEVLFEHDTSFKFVVDSRILGLVNGKNWSRGAAGKFITAYPRTTETFLTLLGSLDAATQDHTGPLILSDRRYRESRVVQYRFGGFIRQEQPEASGEQHPVLMAPDGSTYSDVRRAYFSLPPWVVDPAAPEEPLTAPNTEPTLFNGRFRVERAIVFKNSGGVYLCQDSETGSRVVIKEARPGIQVTDDLDAVALLKNEWRMLCRAEPLAIGPRPVALFQDWEHWFLAEEFIDGTLLGSYSSTISPLLSTSPTPNLRIEFLNEYLRIFELIADSILRLHSVGITLGDLSPNNVLITPGGGIRIIDFEATVDVGHRQLPVYTPGYALAPSEGGEANDTYAFGACMISFLFPLNAAFHLSPDVKPRLVNEIAHDLVLPDALVGLLRDTTAEDPARRPSLERICRSLADIRVRLTHAPVQFASSERQADRCHDIAAYIQRCLARDRDDRAYPADPRVYRTNAWSLSYGALGVLYALRKLGAEGALQSGLDWVDNHAIEARRCAPGMATGLSGIAWGLLECKRRERALKVMALALKRLDEVTEHDLFSGRAGMGMACLRFFAETDDQRFLDIAIAIGEKLQASRSRDAFGSYWPAPTGSLHYGLGHGASGIALFLLYLSVASHQDRWLELGRSALVFEVSRSVRNRDGGRSWKRGEQEGNALLPYWRHGSAGVGAVLVRYAVASGDRLYSGLLEEVALDTNRKYAVFPGFHAGLAGIGQFWLDWWLLMGNEVARFGAEKVATGLQLFSIPRPEGLAFPGDGLSRLSCDLATGSAGIGLFLHRLIHQGEAPLLLDQWYLPAGTRRSSITSASHA